MATISTYRLKGNAGESYLKCVEAFPLTTISSDEYLEVAGQVIDRLLAQGKLDRLQQSQLKPREHRESRGVCGQEQRLGIHQFLEQSNQGDRNNRVIPDLSPYCGFSGVY